MVNRHLASLIYDVRSITGAAIRGPGAQEDNWTNAMDRIIVELRISADLIERDMQRRKSSARFS
jgi:hypothetical protein